MKTFRILRDGVEIARVTADDLEFSKITKTKDGEREDDRFLFKMADPADSKAVFVVALSHSKNLTVEAE
jgi:hypothetical protein